MFHGFMIRGQQACVEHVMDTFLLPLGWQGQLIDHGGQDSCDVEGSIASRCQFGCWMSQFKVRTF